MKLSLTKIAPLSLALFVLLSYQFIGAQWTAAPSSPPAGNVPAPINVGVDVTSAQSMQGGLAMDSLGVFGRGYVQGAAVTAAPTGFVDLDIQGSVGADQYCDRNGNNCVSTLSLGGTDMQIGRAELEHPAGSSGLSTVQVAFPVPYQNPPQVEAALANAYFGNSCRGDGGTFRVEVTNITETGFSAEAPYALGGCGGSQVDEIVWFAKSHVIDMCQVELVSEITNQAGGAVLASDTATVSFPADSTPRIGVVTSSNSCNTLAESRFSTELLRHTPPSPNNQPSAAGFWTEDTFLANQSFINAIPYKVISPLNLTPGTVINTVADNNCGIAQRERVTVTSTVLSCS